MQHLQSISTESIQNNVPDKQEIIKALKKLKNGKAANDIPSELLKYAVDCESLITELERLNSYCMEDSNNTKYLESHKTCCVMERCSKRQC